MSQRIIVIVLVGIILAGWLWSLSQWKVLEVKLMNIESNMGATKDAVSKQEGDDISSNSKYGITVDMWRVFEQELGDYKQRLREGKQQYDTQKAGIEKLVSEMKKNVQEYDKAITSEGEFWVKQLKNYEKAFAKNEQLFDNLNQAVDELRSSIFEVQRIQENRAKGVSREMTNEEQIREEREEDKVEREQIRPQISGQEGRYKTYPPETGKESGEEEESNTVRGTISGSGKYTTY